MDPRYQYYLGKKIHPDTIVLVKSEQGYLTFERDLEIITKHVGISPFPKEMLADVKMVLKNKGYTVSIAEEVSEEKKEESIPLTTQHSE